MHGSTVKFCLEQNLLDYLKTSNMVKIATLSAPLHLSGVKVTHACENAATPDSQF